MELKNQNSLFTPNCLAHFNLPGWPTKVGFLRKGIALEKVYF